MANLWFKNANDYRRVIAEVNSFAEVYKEINNFIAHCNENKPKDKQFKSYYTRIWEEDNMTKIDVGSHCEFFYTELKYPE